MAHGNASDMVFLALVAIAVQWLAFPATLFEDFGPLKAQFKTQSADMDISIKAGAMLLLMIAFTFSGVSWNPLNGKMAGFGGFLTTSYIAYSSFKADSDAFVLRPFYICAAVLFLGSLHIFAFPSNALPPKTPGTKNNHGNASDAVALGLIVASLGCFFYPDHLFKDLGPLKAQFSGTKSADLSTMITLLASLMLIIALMLSGVKWNPINGKMGGFAGLMAAGYIAYSSFQADAGVFVPRLFYVYASLIFFGALHIFAFPSNPNLPKTSSKKD
mmetsp:Transcript_22117/g.39709  ORF Transcript_22117/g.39709 Transcript_22117/m.39709 type:complete len:273 (-) Transcript_22117:144-962(-)